MHGSSDVKLMDFFNPTHYGRVGKITTHHRGPILPTKIELNEARPTGWMVLPQKKKKKHYYNSKLNL